MSQKLDIAGSLTDTSDGSPVDVGFVGCGSHAFRNVYPAVQFTDLNLVATCDLVEEKARRYAEQFGASSYYTDHEAMLAREDLDGVLVVLNLDDDGRPLYPPIATDVLRAGCDVWIEKPPAASVEAIEKLQAVEAETGQHVHVGLKKCFTPAVRKAEEIVAGAEFGDISTISMRYKLDVPRPDADFPLEHGPEHSSLLDIVHPGCVLSQLAGPVESVSCRSSERAGGVVTFVFESGAVGTLHLAGGASYTGPLERLEVVGEDAHLVVENGVDLTYYRPGDRGEYGREPSYIGTDGSAPVTWSPEFSLGQLYNKGLFTLGYYGELAHFAECVREGTAPDTAGLPMARELLQVYEALLTDEGCTITL